MSEYAGVARSEFDARIAAAWARDAATEHASIASFARFTLELLAVGAPARLLVASQDAGRDEVQHAQKCFAIASHFAGKKLGPGTLDVTGVDGARDLASIVAATVHEGCVNETISAALARERAEGAQGEVRSTLMTISEDESRHADLAWRFVTWAVDKGGAPIRIAATLAFEEALGTRRSSADPILEGIPGDVLRACGLLDNATALAVTHRTLVEVISPRAAELLGG
jgi:hypothetical protein